MVVQKIDRGKDITLSHGFGVDEAPFGGPNGVCWEGICKRRTNEESAVEDAWLIELARLVWSILLVKILVGKLLM
jgi:hypothetical protein